MECVLREIGVREVRLRAHRGAWEAIVYLVDGQGQQVTGDTIESAVTTAVSLLAVEPELSMGGEVMHPWSDLTSAEG